MKYYISALVLGLAIGLGQIAVAGVLDPENANNQDSKAVQDQIAKDNLNQDVLDQKAKDDLAKDVADAEKDLTAEEKEAKKKFREKAEACAAAEDDKKTAAEREAAKKKCNEIDVATPTPKSAMAGAPIPKSRDEALAEIEKAKVEAQKALNTENFGGALEDGTKIDAAAETDLTKVADAAKGVGETDLSKTDEDIPGPETPATEETTATPEQIQEAQNTLSATQKLQNGEWPDSKADRVAMSVQYLREKGYNEEVINQVVQGINRENGSWDPTVCTKLGSSACGLGQYVKGTWAQEGGTAANRFDAQAQLDIYANNVNERYQKYTAGTLNCGSGGISFAACDYVHHYAGSWDTKRPDRIQYALDYATKTYANSQNLYANAVAALDGKDVASVLGGMKTSIQNGLGSVFGGGSTGGSSGSSGGNSSVVSGMVNDLFGNSGLNNNGSVNVNNIIGSLTGGTGGYNQNIVTSLLTQLFSGFGGGSGSGSSGSGGSGSSSGSSGGSTGVTVDPVRTYDAIKALQSTCGGELPTSKDAIMLMIKTCKGS
ncbi:MAG: hypothetical protein EON60_12665 [Alphaproteobacteria bacterium]|nr:MAG: hypothetical protein EON60_12665 [Alphaproteobacteria bacterium]